MTGDAITQPVARKRLRMTLATAVFFAVLVIAALGAEVNPATFVSKIGNFASYFDRIATLESGARVWSAPSHEAVDGWMMLSWVELPRSLSFARARNAAFGRST